MQIAVRCPFCSCSNQFKLVWPLEKLECCQCQRNLIEHATLAFSNQKKLDQCPFCGSNHLYRRKDFNQKLGIFLVVLGIALAYFTYGVSLLIVTLIDWVLFRRVQEVGICYRCQAQFRKSSLIDALNPFDLEIFDYYRNLKS